MITKPFLSVREAAEYLRVEYKTVWRLVHKGELPAARIGNLYRIRREDIDALFTSRKITSGDRGEAADMVTIVCARCGDEITSDSEVAGQCEQCGANLCVNCWFLLGRHTCKEHDITGNASTLDSSITRRCGFCLRVLTDGKDIGQCQVEGCSQPLCKSCMALAPEHYCRLHMPSREQRFLKAKNDVTEGRLPWIVTALEAKKAEIAFINRFNQKVHSISTLRNPIDETLYRVQSWDEISIVGDEVDQLLDALESGYLDKNLTAILPVNPWSRYTLPIANPPKGEGLLIEARSFAHLAAHARDGFDASPITLAELLPVLQIIASQAEAVQRPWIIGLASSTGWDQDVKNYLSADEEGRSYYHPLVLAYAIDLRTRAVTYNQLDTRLLPFLSLFSLTFEIEDIQSVSSYVEQYLVGHHGLVVKEIASENKVSQAIVDKALKGLVESGRYRLEQIKGIGRVIVRIEDK